MFDIWFGKWENVLCQFLKISKPQLVWLYKMHCIVVPRIPYSHIGIGYQGIYLELGHGWIFASCIKLLDIIIYAFHNLIDLCHYEGHSSLEKKKCICFVFYEAWMQGRQCRSLRYDHFRYDTV